MDGESIKDLEDGSISSWSISYLSYLAPFVCMVYTIYIRWGSFGLEFDTCPMNFIGGNFFSDCSFIVQYYDQNFFQDPFSILIFAA
jgi:hypothetical protein